MNYAMLDFWVGIAMMVSSIGVQTINIWLYLVFLILGMNLTIGNLRYFYNKKLKRKSIISVDKT